MPSYAVLLHGDICMPFLPSQTEEISQIEEEEEEEDEEKEGIAKEGSGDEEQDSRRKSKPALRCKQEDGDSLEDQPNELVSESPVGLFFSF